MKENKYYTHVNFFLPFCYISEQRSSWRRTKYYTHVNFFLPFCYISKQRSSWRRTNIIPTSISSSHSVIFQNNVFHEGEQILYPRQFLPFCYISEQHSSWRRTNIIPTSISSSRSVIFQNNVLHEGEQILYPRQFLPPVLLYFRTTFFMKENKYYTHINFFHSVIFQNNVLHEGEQILYPRQFLPPILLYFRTTFFMKENKYYTHVNFFLPFCYISEQHSSWRRTNIIPTSISSSRSVIFQNNILHEGEQILYPRQFLPPILLYFRTTFFMKENKYYTHVNFFLPFCYISEQRFSWRRTNIIPTSISSILLYFRTTFFMKENKYYTHVNFFLPFCYISEQRSSWRRTNIIPTSISSSHSVIFQNNVLHEGEQILYPRQFLPPVLLYFRTTFFMKENKYYTHVNFFLPFCYISEQHSSWRRTNIIPTSISSSRSVIFQNNVFHEGEQILYPHQFLPFCYISEQRSSWRRTNIIPTSISSSHSVIFQNNVLHEGEQILYPRQFLPPVLLYFRTTFFMKENKYYTHVNFFLPFCYISEQRSSWRRTNIIPTSISSSRSVIFQNNVFHEGEQILYPHQFLPFCYISEQRSSWRRTNIIPTSISSSHSVIFQNDVFHEGEQILYPRQFLPFCYISEQRSSWRRTNIIPTSISSSHSVIFQNNILHEGEQILYPRQFLPPVLLYFRTTFSWRRTNIIPTSISSILLYFRTTFFMKENKYYTHVNFFLPFCYISEQHSSWRRTNIIPTSISSSCSVIFQNNVLHEGEQILYPHQFFHSVIFQNNVLHEGEQILYPRQFLPPVLLYFRTTFFMKENKYYTHVNFFLPFCYISEQHSSWRRTNIIPTSISSSRSVIFQNNILHEGEQILYPRQLLPPVLLSYDSRVLLHGIHKTGGWSLKLFMICLKTGRRSFEFV